MLTADVYLICLALMCHTILYALNEQFHLPAMQGCELQEIYVWPVDAVH